MSLEGSATPDPSSSLAIATLYDNHHGWLHAFLCRRMGNASDAADLAHDTFLRILSASDHIAEKQAGWKLEEPRAYLAAIAKRLVSNFYRRRSLEQAYLEALAQMPAQHVISEEQRQLVLEALHELDALLSVLPARVRSAFLMAQLEGLGHAEIAARLGVSERTVKRYVAQAIARCIMAME